MDQSSKNQDFLYNKDELERHMKNSFDEVYEHRGEVSYQALMNMLKIQYNYKVLCLADAMDEKDLYFKKGEIAGLKGFIDDVTKMIGDSKAYNKEQGKTPRGVKRIERERSRPANY